MLVNLNRKILLALPDKLQLEYIHEAFIHEYPNVDFKLDGIAQAVQSIIKRHETWHQQYGVVQPNGMKQVDETCNVPGYSEISGYQQIGKILIAPFDWSWDDRGDFDYSFSLFETL